MRRKCSSRWSLWRVLLRSEHRVADLMRVRTTPLNACHCSGRWPSAQISPIFISHFLRLWWLNPSSLRICLWLTGSSLSSLLSFDGKKLECTAVFAMRLPYLTVWSLVASAVASIFCWIVGKRSLRGCWYCWWPDGARFIRIGQFLTDLLKSLRLSLIACLELRQPLI